ncbi:hypothetical protein FROZEN_10 [Erwinia phage vB_EamP_Frozen]|uniref:Uncharacterized protein n=2 Tax=Johnsonvirus frozen TaxID=1982578 RepID=A0A191ZD58_9CAUD|nr:hypothetical protein FROZEN_10 [Erwinia phage vB_EamP_Frozen]ANJ65142.1 hypothetical protein FROZEN_10 [Erwinia phage vB_EamP_Frozen]ANJ65326.1 hypothetical protein GUTMEISTER_10 [Erwinia phage vB_EamP_Gutmeister]
MLLNRNYAVCEICGEPRSKRIHRKCSRILQQRYDAEEWAKILANVRKDELGSTMERSRSVRINGRAKK